MKKKKRNASRSNYKSLRSSTNSDKYKSSKSEIRLIASEKRKRQSRRKFDNFKCFESNRKHKKPLRRLLLQQLSVSQLPHLKVAFNSRKDQKYLRSTTRRQP